MQTFLFLSKLLGTIASAVFGVLGTVHDFRDDSGKLTKWGKVSVVGTIVSAVIAVAAQFVETRLSEVSAAKSSRQALESTRRLETIVTALNRTLQPIDSISVFVSEIDVPLHETRYAAFKSALDARIAEVTQHSNADGVDSRDIAIVSSRKGVPFLVEARHPGEFTDDAILDYAIETQWAELAFFKKPVLPSTFQPFTHGVIPSPDLRVSLRTARPFGLMNDLSKKTYRLSGHMQSVKGEWESNGTIIAIPDLAGCQVFIAMGPFGVGDERRENDEFLKLRQQFDLRSFNLRFGNRERWVRVPDIRKHVNAAGQTYFEYRFPTDPERLFAED